LTWIQRGQPPLGTGGSLLGLGRSLGGLLGLETLLVQEFQIGADRLTAGTEPQPQALEAGARKGLHIKVAPELDQFAHLQVEQALTEAITQTKTNPHHQGSQPGAGEPLSPWRSLGPPLPSDRSDHPASALVMG
jgi:hypothetical protein